MPKLKLLTTVALLVILLSACRLGQVFAPGFTPTPSLTPTPTLTATLTATLTPTATVTPAPTITPTPLPGLGISDEKLVDFAEELGYTLQEVSVDDRPARKYVSSQNSTVLTLVGEPPWVEKVILEIDMKKEDPVAATLTWVYVLEVGSNYAGKPAADWVHDHFRDARFSPQEKVFKDANIILEVDRDIFRLTIEPAAK